MVVRVSIVSEVIDRCRLPYWVYWFWGIACKDFGGVAGAM
jgi:hypothetical protein